MPIDFLFKTIERAAPEPFLEVKGRRVPLALVRNPRAHRYVLRLRPDGVARVTIPRGGSVTEGHSFAKRHLGWLERQLGRLAARPALPKEWLLGMEIHLRGELVRIEPTANEDSRQIRIGSELVNVVDTATDLRRAITIHIWKLAWKELPPRVMEFAKLHHLDVRRVTVRNQKSRWGSCSRGGTISLNWRLIQTPPSVSDYIILHELMHLRQMNHSAKFWREVESACPNYMEVERWLKKHSSLLK